MSEEQTAEQLAAAAQAADYAKNAEWQSKFDTLTADNERLTAKISESNKHTKAAEAKAARQDREKLEAENNYEQLFKSSESRVAELENEKVGYESERHASKENIEHIKFSQRFTDDAGSQKFLVRDFSDRIKIVDGVIRVFDDNGLLTSQTLDDYEAQVRKNPAYDRLIDGVDSSGGSATGNSGKGGASKTYTRAEFAALNPAQKMQVSKDARSGKAELID